MIRGQRCSGEGFAKEGTLRVEETTTSEIAGRGVLRERRNSLRRDKRRKVEEKGIKSMVRNRERAEG